jgi:predicted membrane channel-forming protein YqfA (hemolysin III family)
MDFNATEFAVTLGESINWTSTIIGIAGGIFGIYIWFYDRKNMKKATLYYPLFLACQGIIDIIKDPDALGEERCRAIFSSCAKTLDEIVYTHGSIIHLEKANDLKIFLAMKKGIDENLEFIQGRSWAAMKDKFINKELKEIESYAKILLSRCREEVKDIKNLPE